MKTKRTSIFAPRASHSAGKSTSMMHSLVAAPWSMMAMLRMAKIPAISPKYAALMLSMGVVSVADALDVSGVSNSYYEVAAVAGTTATLGGGSAGAGHVLAAGDKVILIEMTGANMGVFERLTVSAAGGGSVTFSTAITRTYASGAKQLIHVPNDASVTVTADITAPAWDGAVGGVVALSGSTLTLDANIDASEKGFSAAFPPSGGSDGSGPAAFYNGFWTTSAGGGGGIIGGGGGGGGSPQTTFYDTSTAPASQATAIAAGLGVAGSATTFAGGNGGNPGLVGNGGDGDIGQASNGNYPGTPGAGGGSYGAGGGTVASVYSSSYSGGGGGGGSWTGGGQGGRGGTASGGLFGEVPNPNGLSGAPALPAAITTADHFLHDGDARLMMGGAGGAGPVPNPFATVTIAGTVYAFDDWIDIYNQAGVYSLANNVMMGPAIAVTLGVPEADVRAQFPELFTWSNPKNAGFSSMPGVGGTGLVSVTSVAMPCAITAVDVTPGACNDNATPGDSADDYYTASVTVTFSDKPSSGNLVLSGAALHSGNSVSTVAVGSTTSATTHTYAGVKIKANNVANALTATFSDDVACTLTVNPAAVPNCSVPLCDVTDLVITPGACNDNATPNDMSDDYFTASVAVTFANKPASGNLVLSGVALHSANAVSTVAVSSTTSATTHNFVGVRLKADNNANALTATFSADPVCTMTVNSPLVPNCSVPICDMASLDVSPGACSDNGTPANSADDYYVANVIVVFANMPSSGNLDLSGAALHSSNSVSSVAAASTNSSTTHTFVGVRIKANGSVNAITATFSADPACTLTNNAGSVPSCSVPPAICCPELILAAP